MELISLTKKYATIRIPIEEYNSLLAKENKIKEESDYYTWFKENYEKVYWEDEYGSWNHYWKNKTTGEKIHDGSCKIPRFVV